MESKAFTRNEENASCLFKFASVSQVLPAVWQGVGVVNSLCVIDASDAEAREWEIIFQSCLASSWTTGYQKNTESGWLGSQSCVGWRTRNQHFPESTMEADIPILRNLSSSRGCLISSQSSENPSVGF